MKLIAKPEKSGIAYLFPDDTYAPTADHPIKINDRLSWLRLEIPISGLKHVNLWLDDMGDGRLSLIDTGFNSERDQHIITNLLNTKNITDFIITHFHPDHIGMLGFLKTRYPDANVHIADVEYQITKQLRDDHYINQLKDIYPKFYTACGCDLSLVSDMTKRADQYKRSVSHPLPPLEDVTFTTQKLFDYDCIYSAGHTPKHLSLYHKTDNIYIAGDMVLPKITSNVSVWSTAPDMNPLKDYLESLKEIKEKVDAEALVLPSHGEPFYGLHDRIDYVIAHHDYRLSFLYDLIKRGQSLNSFQLSEQLFNRKLDLHNLMFAIGETLSHLNYLIMLGHIQREEKNNIFYYSIL